MKRFVGFNIEEETLEKLKIISFFTKKNRTQLLEEGFEMVIEKHFDSFDKFQKYIKKIKDKK
jgi:hypothetical protein